ncbi:MAG TPA: ester cyclase [Ktedonobacteraceae bacterium]|nr:ester cyclase [Ktedonobacteraceae bacterium]
MSTEANVAVARRVFDDLFSQGKLDAADEIYAPDHTSHDAQAPGVNGAAAMKHYIGMYRAAFPDLHMAVDDIVAEGDKVVIRWTARGTHRGELMGVPPTGKQAVVTGINIIRVKDGRVAEEWINWDTLGLLQQLGVAPKM